jgi:hypothetical protein
MNGERICYNGTKWGVKGFKGVGQVHCDGGVVGLINQLQQVYGLEVDKEHPLYFNPEKSGKWVVVCMPDNGR